MQTILVVEDSACILKLVTVNLKAEGYHVITAADGKTALAALHDNTCCDDIALILLDLNLPDMSGERIIEAVSYDNCIRNIPIVLTSGEEPEKPFRHPVVAAISKPYRIQVLMDIVRSIVEEQNEKTAYTCDR